MFMLQVTELVAREESKANGESPRKLWPPENECPACRDSVNQDSDWDEETVYIYLMEFYGLRATAEIGGAYHQQRSDDKVATVERALGVPHWAAVGMAMAGCGFIVTLCYSRVRKLRFK